MTKLKQILERHGLTVNDVAKKGIPYCSVWQQWTGRRSVGVKAAIRYEELLGIPRWELRPDLWAPPEPQAQD